MKYITLQRLNIRKQPRITSTNRVGTLDMGTEREVYETIVDSQNNTWGRISEPDNYGQSLWFMIKNINKEFARPVVETAPVDIPAGFEARLASLEARVAKLEAR